MTALRVGPVTSHIGLVPTVIATHTEPFHVSTQIATLDWVTSGRAGQRIKVSSDPAEYALFGRRDPEDRESLFGEAADHVEVQRRLWDSWEDDAEIRDAATGRFIDRDKLHYIDFEGRTSPCAARRSRRARRRASRWSPRSRTSTPRTGSPPAAPTSCS